jgi:hypothetical protein
VPIKNIDRKGQIRLFKRAFQFQHQFQFELFFTADGDIKLLSPYHGIAVYLIIHAVFIGFFEHFQRSFQRLNASA